MSLLEELQALAKGDIEVLGLEEHTKAGEKYIAVRFSYANQKPWDGFVPYFYRRTGLFLEDPEYIIRHLEAVYHALKKENARKWVKTEKKLWKDKHSGKDVTKEFFDKLLNLSWNCTRSDLPTNSNWGRRIQAIKEMGYTIATDTKRYNSKLKKKTTHVILLPLERWHTTGYETIGPKLRERIIKVLGSYDAYEGKIRPSHALLPDHKFPEISWDHETRQENPDDMSDEEIRRKFQLLDNQRNLQKREACRKVLETGNLGTIFGIEYYMNGDGKWPEGVPKRGSESEEGWKLCPWYDIEAWRRSLNEFLRKNRAKKGS